MQTQEGGSVGVTQGGAEIFGRFTTSVVCRGIEGESWVWHVIGRRYIFATVNRTGRTEDLSLSRRIFSVQVP